VGKRARRLLAFLIREADLGVTLVGFVALLVAVLAALGYFLRRW
jgi:hypothetical protein